MTASWRLWYPTEKSLPRHTPTHKVKTLSVDAILSDKYSHEVLLSQIVKCKIKIYTHCVDLQGYSHMSVSKPCVMCLICVSSSVAATCILSLIRLQVHTLYFEVECNIQKDPSHLSSIIQSSIQLFNAEWVDHTEQNEGVLTHWHFIILSSSGFVLCRCVYGFVYFLKAAVVQCLENGTEIISRLDGKIRGQVVGLWYCPSAFCNVITYLNSPVTFWLIRKWQVSVCLTQGSGFPVASLGSGSWKDAAGIAPEWTLWLPPPACPRLLHWRLRVFSAAGARLPGRAKIRGAHAEDQGPSVR